MDKKALDAGKKNIAGQIAYNRIKSGLTQQQLADCIGTTKSGISRIESGRQNITYDQLFKIAEGLNMSVSMVMEEKNEYKANYDPSNTEYELRLYDEVLIGFSLYSDIDITVVIDYVNDSQRELFPLNLTVTPEGLLEWISERSIPKNREYIGAILQAVGLKSNTVKGVLDVCKGLSLNDSFWIVPKNFEGKFADYNLYDNDFSSILSLVAYTGYPYEDKNFTTSPEFTTGGMLRKAWRMKKDGIWLYKGGTEDFANAGNEPYSEYYAYQVAKKMGLNATEYSLENWKGILASKCRLFTSIDTSFVPAGKIIKTGGLSACLEYYKSLGDDYYQDLVSMLVFDAVILNEDRHFGNFGLLRDNHTGKIISTAPIFDNGSSLLSHAMKSDFETDVSFDAYVSSMRSFTGESHTDICKKLIGKKQKTQLRKLIGFKFTESDVCNLPHWRLERLEELIQRQVKELL